VGFTKLEWRVICFADFGDATTRQRFILMARSDGKSVRWPTPSRAPADRAALLGLEPWRPARDIIDWSTKSRSIFDRDRPLAPATIRRIYAGITRFRWPEPYMAQ
jgi:DNA (cytosine-5)-methyltransferase 1